LPLRDELVALERHQADHEDAARRRDAARRELGEPVAAKLGQRRARGRARVLMLLENNAYPDDVRVRLEAEALTAAGYWVTVLAPRGPGQARRDHIAGVDVRWFRLLPEGQSAMAILIEYLIAHIQLIARAGWHILRGADVVHLHNPPDTLFPAGLLARL